MAALSSSCTNKVLDRENGTSTRTNLVHEPMKSGWKICFYKRNDHSSLRARHGTKPIKLHNRLSSESSKTVRKQKRPRLFRTNWALEHEKAGVRLPSFMRIVIRWEYIGACVDACIRALVRAFLHAHVIICINCSLLTKICSEIRIQCLTVFYTHNCTTRNYSREQQQ